MRLFLRSKHLPVLLSLIMIAIFMHFYNLNWGAPFYFHPDERNIASGISQLHFPSQMNPHFFAYGSLPIYFIYFLGLINNYLTTCHLNFSMLFKQTAPCNSVLFEQAIIISRIVAASASIILIPLIYLIGKRLKNAIVGLIAAFLATTSIGFIQFSHFGTYEMLLTLLTTLLFYFCIAYLHKQDKLSFFFVCLTAGVLLATKVSSIVLLPFPLLILAIHTNRHFIKNRTLLQQIRIGLYAYGHIILYILIITGVFIMTNPFTFLDTQSFLGSMHYEAGVALGTMPVFYTGEFYQSLPIIFSFTKVYPFLLNPLLTAFFIPVFFYIIYLAVKNKNSFLLLLISYLMLLFVSQAFLYVQWVRYLLPTLPFIYLMLAITAEDLYQQRNELTRNYANLIAKASAAFIAILCFSYGLSFFLTDFVQQNTIFAAVDFASKKISSKAPILSETYDMGITAFNPHFSNIDLFNFYDLDNPGSPSTLQSLAKALDRADYLILPSQRVMKIRLLNAKKFPNGHDIYAKLFENKTQFRLIYQTPCDIFCHIAYDNPVFSYEETATVFDRPTVFIFKKENN